MVRIGILFEWIVKCKQELKQISVSYLYITKIGTAEWNFDHKSRS